MAGALTLTRTWTVNASYELCNGANRQHLKQQTGMVLMALLDNPEVSDSLLVELLWPDSKSVPNSWRNCIMSMICGLRQLLKPYGLEINMRYSSIVGPHLLSGHKTIWYLQNKEGLSNV